MNKKQYFLEIFSLAEKKYGANDKRLASDNWSSDWQTLVATMMSAQSRDETTIPIAEKLFFQFPTLESIANSPPQAILSILKSLNYNRTKTKNIIAAANYLLINHKGKVPQTIEELILIPGVGRKTANLVLSVVHNKEGICVDTHVHRIANVLGLVKTKNPTETEYALRKLAPKEYWSKINRLFVLWGKDCPGRDKERLLKKLSP